MISAVSVDANDAVYSAKRLGTASFICANTNTAATPLYKTTDSIYSLHVSPSGAIHAIGKARYHTNAGGAWRSTKFAPTNGSAIHAITDDDIVVGTMKGLVLRSTDGGATWLEVANVNCYVTDINSSYVMSHGVLGRLDGNTLTKLVERASFVGMHEGTDVIWLCGNKSVHQLKGSTLVTIVECTNLDSSLYGIGVGTAGVFVHAGYEVSRVAGNQLACARDNADKALMVKNATYSTAIASNGTRVVAGGARSVLVEDGKGFIEWPELGEKAAAAIDVKPAKAPPKKK